MRIQLGGVLLAVGFVMSSANPNLAWAAPPAEACSLVTPAEVGSVLGVQVKSGERLVPNNATLCGFGGPGNLKRVVTAIVSTTLYENEKHPLPGIKEEQVSGLGDEAHFMTTPGFGTGLSVRKGNFAFKVRVYGFPIAQVEEKEKALAKQILARL